MSSAAVEPERSGPFTPCASIWMVRFRLDGALRPVGWGGGADATGRGGVAVAT
jgi:hypothetical protein